MEAARTPRPEQPGGPPERGGDPLERAHAILTGALPALRRALWPPRPRHFAVAFALLLAAVSLRGVWFHASLRQRLPSALDWRAAAALLERDAAPGDVVMVAPPWAERPRLIAPPSLPVMSVADVAGEDLVGVRRVWLLSLQRAPGHDDALEASLLERAATVDGPRRLGAIEVSRFDLRQPLVAFAFVPDWLARAAITRGGRSCALEPGGAAAACSGGVRLAREVRELAGGPRPALCVEPVPATDAPVAIELPAVRMGRVLRGHLGGAPGGTARLAVKLDGQEIGAFEAGAAGAWEAFQIDTALHTGRTRALGFELAGEGGGRLCFDAMTLP